tara:strand:- start:943 stop:1548 length:606 start_codon:yes stop_codon:yes gene_type:complete
MKTQPMLICIPDISGFTAFMSETDIELSSVVIPSLLNKIIYANNIGLKVSEIEGDAVLFYKSGDLPSFKELVDQCKKFYDTFYDQIFKLKKKYDDHEDATKIPETLGLKIILHYGDSIGSAQIGKNIKLMGEDVIVAHRLLKNNIQSDEYLLFSKSLMDNYRKDVIERNFGWGLLQDGDETYKHLGGINYSYIHLRPSITF